MKKKYYWVIVIVVVIVFLFLFTVNFLVWPDESQMYCLLCRSNQFRAECYICNDSHVNWSSKVMVSDKFVDCIKYCTFIERSVKNSLAKNITCETMKYLCDNYLGD